jgi:hypothetical protein
MEQRKKQSKRAWLARAGLMLPGLLAGCHHHDKWWCVDNCATIPPGAIPAPCGTYVRRAHDIQSAKAEADDFTIYKHEWLLAGKELGPYGRYHLNELVRRLPGVPFPVVIQPTPDGELNEARRKLIVHYLDLYGIPDAEQRVLVAFPQAEGLYGEEAERVYQQILEGGQNIGFGGLFGGGLGGLGGGGFGGGFGGGIGGFSGAGTRR